MAEAANPWDAELVRNWLESRIAAARADQAVAERAGRGRQDDCDQANAEEMVCGLFRSSQATDSQSAFLAALKALLDRDEYTGRGVYDDARFDRHVKGYIRKLMKMAKANAGFEKVLRYQ